MKPNKPLKKIRKLKVRTNITIDPDIKKMGSKTAAKQNMSFSEFVEILIYDYSTE